MSFMDPKPLGMLQCFPSPTYLHTRADTSQKHFKLILPVVGFFFKIFYLTAGAQIAVRF